MNIWSYWSGPKPPWIDVCLRSMQRCCQQSDFHLLTPADAIYLTKDLLAGGPRWLNLPPGVGTDCLRAALLFKHGGLWVDADTVLTEDPINLFRERHDPDQFLYSCWTAPPRRAVAGYVYSPKGHPVARRWLDFVNGALEHAEQVGWGHLGERVLTLLVDGSPSGQATWQMPLETFMPVDVDSNVGRYFEESGWRDLATGRTIGFGLNYSWMMEHRRAAMLDHPNDSTIMIHRLLRENA